MLYSRRLPKFEYLTPDSLKEACAMLEGNKGQASLIAGGTILLALMKERRWVSRFLIGLKNVPGLDYVTYDGDEGLKIGTLATHRVIANSPVIREKFSLLAMACNELGSPQIRNMGTIGGNLCCRFPRAEAVPPLIALNARAKISSANEERIIPVADVSRELKTAELAAVIQIPDMPPNSGMAYQKYAVRRAIDYANVGVAVVITSSNGSCDDIKIALGGVTATSLRPEKAEGIIKGEKLTDKIISEAAQSVSDEAQVSSDIDFSAEYKKKLLKALTRRSLKEAWDRAKNA